MVSATNHASLNDQISIKDLSIEDLKQNPHVQGLLEALNKCASNDDFLETRRREFTMTAIVNWTKSGAAS